MNKSLYLLIILIITSCIDDKESDLKPNSDCSNFSIQVISSRDLSCESSGAILVETSGGTGMVMYRINGGDLGVSNSFDNLQAGTYDIQAEDESGCIATITATVVGTSDAISLTIESLSPATCGAADGAVTVTASGGSGTYTFGLDGGDLSSNNAFSNLEAGSYTVTAADEKGCQTQIEVIIDSDGGDLSIGVEVLSAAGCNESNGSLQVATTGGDGTYAYSLNGEAIGVGSELTVPGLAVGDYSIEVTDGNGCSDLFELSLSSGVSLSSDIMPIINANCALNSSCHGDGSSRPVFTTATGIINNAERIKARTGASSNQMPPSGSLPQAQIDLIACWVDDGAQNN